MVEQLTEVCATCGADMSGYAAQLTLNGSLICITCATDPKRWETSKPEARDDGK